MISKKTIEKIKREAKKYFIGASGCHDWSHVERVHDLAVVIAKKEMVDMGILRLAAYLHDIGRKEEMRSGGKICHAEKGVDLAKNILAKNGIDKKIADKICHCILAHRYRNDHQPATIEAKILFDADKLDSIGAVGVARAFLFAGNAGSNRLYTGNEKRLIKQAKDRSYSGEDSALYEYYYKLKKIKSKIITKGGKDIAGERHQFMVKYFQRFQKEIKGLL